MNYELINGVEILSEGACMESIVMGVVFLVAGILLFWVFLYEVSMKSKSKNDIIGIIVIIFLSINALIIGFLSVNNAPTQYKVTVSDDVSMNDFNDEYKIVQQEGRIYTIKERSK